MTVGSDREQQIMQFGLGRWAIHAPAGLDITSHRRVDLEFDTRQRAEQASGQEPDIDPGAGEQSGVEQEGGGNPVKWIEAFSTHILNGQN